MYLRILHVANNKDLLPSITSDTDGEPRGHHLPHMDHIQSRNGQKRPAMASTMRPSEARQRWRPRPKEFEIQEGMNDETAFFGDKDMISVANFALYI